MNARVEILHSQVDGEMAQSLSGAGGACCQFCTAIFKQDRNSGGKEEYLLAVNVRNTNLSPAASPLRRCAREQQPS